MIFIYSLIEGSWKLNYPPSLQLDCSAGKKKEKLHLDVMRTNAARLKFAGTLEDVQDEEKQLRGVLTMESLKANALGVKTYRVDSKITGTSDIKVIYK